MVTETEKFPHQFRRPCPTLPGCEATSPIDLLTFRSDCRQLCWWGKKGKKLGWQWFFFFSKWLWSSRWFWAKVCVSFSFPFIGRFTDNAREKNVVETRFPHSARKSHDQLYISEDIICFWNSHRTNADDFNAWNSRLNFPERIIYAVRIFMQRITLNRARNRWSLHKIGASFLPYLFTVFSMS